MRPLRAKRARQRVVLRAPGGALPRTPAPKCRLFFLSASLFCIGTASAFGWLLAYYQIPKAVVKFMAPWATGVTSTGFVIAVIFLIVGCFIDAIPAIIILGPLIEPLAKDTLNTLQDYHWPGNVRELESIIERAVITSQGTALQVLDRFENSRKAGEQETRDDGKALGEREHDYILQVLQKTGWRIEGETGAAVILGLNPSTLRGRMRKYGIRR